MYKLGLLIDIILYLRKIVSQGMGDVVRLLWTKLDATIPLGISNNIIKQDCKSISYGTSIYQYLLGCL